MTKHDIECSCILTFVFGIPNTSEHIPTSEPGEDPGPQRPSCPGLVPAIARVANNYVARCSLLCDDRLGAGVPQLMSCYLGCEVARQWGDILTKSEGGRNIGGQLINYEKIELINDEEIEF